MEKMRLDVLRDDAQEVRDLLRPLLSCGLSVAESNRWFHQTRFVITGDAPALARVRVTLDGWAPTRLVDVPW